MADLPAPLHPVQLHSSLSRIMLKCKVIPVDKLSAGLMRKCVISQLFNSFFLPLGLCFFITAALQTTSLEDWLSFLWVIFWLAFRWQRERWCRLGGGADKPCHFLVMKSILDDGNLRKSFPYSFCSSCCDAMQSEIKCELSSSSKGQRADYLSRTFLWHGLIGRLTFCEDVLLWLCLWVHSLLHLWVFGGINSRVCGGAVSTLFSHLKWDCPLTGGCSVQK